MIVISSPMKVDKNCVRIWSSWLVGKKRSVSNIHTFFALENFLFCSLCLVSIHCKLKISFIADIPNLTLSKHYYITYRTSYSADEDEPSSTKGCIHYIDKYMYYYSTTVLSSDLIKRFSCSSVSLDCNTSIGKFPVNDTMMIISIQAVVSYVKEVVL